MTRKTTRFALARRLQDVALRIASGKRVRIGSKWVRLPDEVVLEEETESKDGETEIEFEIRWRSARSPAARRKVA